MCRHSSPESKIPLRYRFHRELNDLTVSARKIFWESYVKTNVLYSQPKCKTPTHWKIYEAKWNYHRFRRNKLKKNSRFGEHSSTKARARITLSFGAKPYATPRAHLGMSERFSFEPRKPEYSASRFCSQIVQARIGHSNIDNLHGRPFGQNHGPFLHPGYTALFWTLNWTFILHWCLFMCSARWSDLEKLRSQCWHLKGLRPVCLRWCRVSSSDRANRHSHPSQEQLYGFSPGNDKWDNVEIQTAHVIDIPHAPGLCRLERRRLLMT